jgi:hypothetical protein
MARTKQTARTSTGEPAPRHHIGSFPSVPSPVQSKMRSSARIKKQQARKTKTTTRQGLSTALQCVTSATQSTMVPTAAKSNVTTTAASSVESGTGPGSNPVGGEIYSSNVCLSLRLTGSSLTLPPMQYCSICRNGGLMHDCDLCPRTVCHKCVPLPLDIPPGASFKCLYCFSYPNGRQSKPTPYMVQSHCFFVRHDILTLGTGVGPFLFEGSH